VGYIDIVKPNSAVLCYVILFCTEHAGLPLLFVIKLIHVLPQYAIYKLFCGRHLLAMPHLAEWMDRKSQVYPDRGHVPGMPFRATCVSCRVLLFGVPSDSTRAEALQAAALEIASGLPEQLGSAPTACCTGQHECSLQALLTVLMWGLASLTQAQQRVAASEVLRLAGAAVNDSAADQLTQQMRSVWESSAACDI